MALVDPTAVSQLYWCGLATLTGDPGEIPRYDKVFALVFRGMFIALGSILLSYHWIVIVFGAPVGHDQLILAGIVVATAIALTAVYRWTGFGLRTRASAACSCRRAPPR